MINLESTYGYDCVCQWPTAPDPEVYGEGKKPEGLAGLEWEAGCKAVEFRNVDSSFKGLLLFRSFFRSFLSFFGHIEQDLNVILDNMILYGGGWNAQRDPVDKKLVKPYYGYYGLEATDSPWKFKVRNAAQKIPAPDRSAHKGKKTSKKGFRFSSGFSLEH